MTLTKRSFILAFAIIIISLADACNRSVNEVETAHLKTAIERLDVNDNTKWIVVLPGLGCHGCIQEAEVFMRDYIKNKDILFVLTNISSLKILQQKINIQIYDYPNVYVDQENKFVIPTNNSIYPCIIQIENGKIKTHVFQSPQNGAAFQRLKSLTSIQ